MSEYDEIIKLGIISVIIIGRELQMVANRADELGITEICQSVSDSANHAHTAPLARSFSTTMTEK